MICQYRNIIATFSILLWQIVASKDQYNNSSEVNYLLPGKCKGLWRPQRLQGRCFGLTLHSQYAELSTIKVVNSAKECKSICCNLQDKCLNWQYQLASKQCKLGKDRVRYGTEGYDSPYWCDPLPTSDMWHGKKLDKMGSDGSCLWKSENLRTQCFGLGVERKSANKERILSHDECQKSCCDANANGKKGCEIYQFIESRGCFHSVNNDVWCDDKVQGAYDGGRKCIPGYCDGNEEKQLAAYANRMNALP
mmetsp:Transcript_22196/g.31882  ORF Transcript_22196/g.31882 Transcript_22196/m.31882 type:complete len:250 (+) Transcript_22196:53-802(+)